MLFTHCFSQGPSTRLSFPSMFTSRWDSQLTQVFSPHFPYSLATTERQLQDVLDDAGYDTAAVLPASYFQADRWQSLTRRLSARRCVRRPPRGSTTRRR